MSDKKSNVDTKGIKKKANQNQDHNVKKESLGQNTKR